MKKRFYYLAMIIPLIINQSFAGPQDDLWVHIMQCDLEGVKNDVTQGADVKVMHPSNQNSLALAYLCPEVTAWLIEQGVDPNSDGGGALVGAGTNYSFEVMKLLLDAGANPDTVSPIYAASAVDIVLRQTNCVPCLKLLKEAGANLAKADPELGNTLHTLAIFAQTPEQRKDNYAKAKSAMEGYGLNVPDWYGNLGEDRNGTSAEMLGILLDGGADIDYQYSKAKGGYTPLMVAIGITGSPAKSFVAEALLVNGADISIQSSNKKQTAMSYASKAKLKDIVSMIEDLGGKSRDKVAETPFSKITADISKIKVSMDFPAEGRKTKNGGGYSANVDLLDPKPKRVALISYYLYDPASSKAKVSSNSTTKTSTVSAWRMLEVSAQVGVNEFYNRSINELVAGFKEYGMELLTPDQFLVSEEMKDFYYGFSQETARAEKTERTQRGDLNISATVSTIKVCPKGKGYRPFFVVNEPMNASVYANFINMGIGAANRKMTSSLGYELANGLGVDAVVVCYIVARKIDKIKTDKTVDAVSLFMFGPNPVIEGATDKNRGQFYCGTRFFAKNSIYESNKTGTDYANIGNVMTALSRKTGNWVINGEK